MAYVKQNYMPGDVLTAERVNEMQDAIIKNEGNIDSHIDNINNPHNVTATQIGAAPSGYGLGGDARLLTDKDDLNNIRETGWYKFHETYGVPKNTPTSGMYLGQYGLVEVKSYAYNNVVQKVYNMYSLNYDNICAMRTIDNTVGEWEWVNPPMALGQEYRTTERHRGLSVYTKLVNCGAISHGGTVALGVINILRYSAWATNGTVYPYENPDSNYYRAVFIQGGTVRMKCGSSAAGTDGVHCQIWYTKD